MSLLMQTLIAQGALSVDTVVSVGHQRHDQRREWVICSIDTAATALHLRELDGTVQTTAAWHTITAIDGMAPERFAEVYNINFDGSAKIVGKKRGRKPKMR